MSTYKTPGIILRRQDYGEADRIYTILTPASKVSAIAKSVRRITAKLSSHLELFSEIDLMFARGKNLDIVTSARQRKSYHLSNDYERLRRGFLMLEMVHKLSDTQETAEIYDCLKAGLESLQARDPAVVELAFKLNLLKSLGQTPQLQTTVDTQAEVLPDTVYGFSHEQGGVISGTGSGPELDGEALKLWRLCLRHGIEAAASVSGSGEAARRSLDVCDGFYEYIYHTRFRAAEL